MNNEITFWGAGTIRTFRPLWTAEELGLNYTLLPIGPRTGETSTVEYTKLNPKQKIPYMRCGALGLSESVAICRYLIARYGDNVDIYQPLDLADRAREDEWVCYCYGEIDETSLYVMRRHGDLKHIYGEAPKAVAAAAEYAAKHLQIVATHLRDHAYMMGSQFGLADIIATTCIDWADAYGLALTGPLVDYRERNRRRPAYLRAQQRNDRP